MTARLGQAAALLWRYPRANAPVFGVLAACGFQPLALWPLTLIGVAGLIALMARAETPRRAALLGWLWGLGHFTLSDNWIATAFTYQAKMPAWLGWGGVLALATVLAVFPALTALGGWLFRRRPEAMVLAFAGCWIITEWLRSWVFSGFAWNPLGAVLLLGPSERPGLARYATWLGSYGLSGLVVVLAGWLLLISQGLLATRLGRGISAGATLLWSVNMLVFGPINTLPYTDGNIPYTLVQPGIAQDDLNDPAHFGQSDAVSTAMSLPAHPGQRRLVLWPESGVPDYMRSGYPAWFYQYTYGHDPAAMRQRLAQAIGPGSLLLTGTIDLDIRGQQVVGARNVVTALDDRGALTASYTKAHLVPFGEYLPLRGVLEPLGLARLVPGDIDLEPGPGPRTLDLGPYGKVGIQICYEIIFSGRTVDPAHRPDYIVNPTNDGWFGDWGPPQHLAQARLRAIEEGLPVLRATTNGISAVIDADGIVRQFAPRGVAARLDGVIPPPHPPTLFARFGNALALSWAGILLGAALLVMWRGRR